MSATATWARRLRAGAVFAAALGLGACGGGGAADDGPARLSPDSLSAWMAQGRPFVLLDVRPDSLFEAARIPGSVRVHGIPFSSFREVLPADPEVPLVFVSEDGTRPPGAPDRAAEAAGFGRVAWLEGGVEGWVRTGHAVAGSRIFAR